MAKIKVYINDYIFEKDKVKDFVQRIENLIVDLSSVDMDFTELEQLKQSVISNKCYNSKNIWYLEEIENKVNIYRGDEGDLPF